MSVAEPFHQQIIHMFKLAFARRVAFLLVAVLLAWLGFGGNVRAQDYSQCQSRTASANINEVYCPSRDEALEQASLHRDYNLALDNTLESSGPCVHSSVGTGLSAFGRYYCYYRNKSNGSMAGVTARRYLLSSECPSGLSWDNANNKCACPSGYILYNGQCKTCLSLNSQPGSPALSGVITRPFSERCVAGCKLAMTPKSGWCTSLGGVGGGATLCEGIFEYTGDSCAAGPTDPKEPPVIDKTTEPSEQCAPAGAGQTMCINKRGEHCYTASTGKKICWTPGETGQKSDGDTMQRREPGPTPTPPNPPTTKDGDTYNQNGSPITATTTNGTTAVTTTTTNYTTQNGTNGDNQVPGSPDGQDEGDKNGSTGGGDCAAPPVSSGDQLLAQIAYQAWATRCAISDRNKQQDDQAADLANADDGLGTVDEAGIFGEGGDITGQLSESLIGGGGGQCATGWTLMGEPIELPDGFWSLASWIGMLIVALAYLWAAVLLSEG